LLFDNCSTSGFGYDGAGNLTNDTIHAYTFDAENRISNVDNVSAYVYDGDGLRAKKLAGENTRSVYGIGGQLLAEFDGSTGNLKKEYLYGSSMITVEPTAMNSNGTQYSTSDHLGSPRVVTNSGGSVSSRHDYLPFGEELTAGPGGRTPQQGYGAGDGVRQKFTDKERDIETGLDYFGARYYGSTQGRFTSPDPANVGAIELDPQSWNGYAYVGNTPLIATDPDGLWKEFQCTGGGRCFEAEKDDSLSTLAKQYNLNYKDLVKQFGNVGVEVGQTLLVLNPGSIPTSRDGDPAPNGGCELCRANGDQIRWRMDYDAYLEVLRRGPYTDTIILFGPITRLSRLLPAAEIASETKLLGTARMNLLNAAQSAKLRNFIKYLYREKRGRGERKHRGCD